MMNKRILIIIGILVIVIVLSTGFVYDKIQVNSQSEYFFIGLDLEGKPIKGNRPLKVYIYDPNETIPIYLTDCYTNPDDDLEIDLSGFTYNRSNNYDILIEIPNYLHHKILNHNLIDNITTSQTIRIGNLNDIDQIIDPLDWAVILSKWGTNDVNADFNEDGIVNTIDFSFMNRNWLKTGYTCQDLEGDICLETENCPGKWLECCGTDRCCSEECVTEVICGNNICGSGEDGFNCPSDCCVSGDGVCRTGCTSENDDSCELQGNWTADDYIENRLPAALSEQYLKVENINESNLDAIDKKLLEAKTFLIDKEKETINPEAKDLLNRIIDEIEQAMDAISSIKRKGEITQQDKEIIISHLEKGREYLIQVLRIQYENMIKEEEWKYDEFIEKYKPKEYFPMKFSVTAIAASYWGPAWNPTEEIVKEIDLISELPVDSIRFDLMFDVWQQNEDVVDTIIKEIRDNGKKIWINFCGGETWRENPYSWNDFKRIYLENLEHVVREYKPEYVGVANEGPGFLAEMVKERVSEEEWVRFAEECAKKVKSIKPDCFVFVNTIPYSDGDRFFDLLMDHDNEIDVIGIDPYDLKELEERGEYALAHWSNKDKELWITETWCTWDGSYPTHLCDKYIVASLYYAQTKGFNGFNIFYGQNLHTQNFKIIKESNKTPAFYTYEELIEEVRGKTEE